jgi:UDP-3-O-[3-hydroxymyristoyl] glucosamine N-acyltransferase
MADSRFFHRTGPYTLGEIASITGATIERGSADLIVNDIAPLDLAGPGQLSFLDNVRYREIFRTSNAAACFVAPEMVANAPDGMALLVTKTPYKANALAAQAFYPDIWPAARIAKSATIDPTAKIGEGCIIDENVVIAAEVVIGNGTWIEANTVIGTSCLLGERCRIGSNVTLSHCHIGQATRIYPGARIGQDGFGFAIDPAGFVKVPQLGRVIIGAHVEIGANTTIDRGASGDTIIGDGCWIDNLVQLGHNVKLGRGCVIVAQVGIAGSTVFDDYVVVGGQAGFAGHLKIGKGARIAAQSGVMRDIPAGGEVMGFPAIAIKQFMRQAAILNKMTKSKDKK